MGKYKRGKIYKIYSLTSNLVYYGSTIRSLSHRFKNHYYSWKTGSRKYSSWKIFEHGNVRIELVEKYPCSSRKELEAREAEYIINNDCVNIYIAGTWKKKKKILNQNGKSREIQLREIDEKRQETNDQNPGEDHSFREPKVSAFQGQDGDLEG